jgi:hypothetical protein
MVSSTGITAKTEVMRVNFCWYLWDATPPALVAALERVFMRGWMTETHINKNVIIIILSISSISATRIYLSIRLASTARPRSAIASRGAPPMCRAKTPTCIIKLQEEFKYVCT